jgi:hypothetical protein
MPITPEHYERMSLQRDIKVELLKVLSEGPIKKSKKVETRLSKAPPFTNKVQIKSVAANRRT